MILPGSYEHPYHTSFFGETALPHNDIANDPFHRWFTFFDQNISEELLMELISYKKQMLYHSEEIANNERLPKGVDVH